MKKLKKIIERLNIAWFIITKWNVNNLGEFCEKCNSHRLSHSYEQEPQIKEDGTKMFCYKYLCKDCGATATYVEFWDTKLKDIEKTSEK